MREPILRPTCNGWAAHGTGWAVHAPTRAEAIERCRRAELEHKKSLARPPFYEQREAALHQQAVLMRVAEAIRDTLEQP